MPRRGGDWTAITDLDIHDMVLLTGAHHEPVGLAECGLAIIEEHAF